MTSNAAPCLSGSPAISNSETVVVIPLVAASGSINGPVSFTPGTSGIAYSVGAIANATSYIWSYTGTGVTINGTGTNVTLDFALNATAGDIVVNGHNNCGNGLTATLSLISGTQLDITNLFLESLYNGGGTMRQAYDGATPKWPNGVADHIKVELHSAANYGNIIYSQPDVPLSTNGAASLIIPGNYKDSYYITIRHRNSIETTTATAISFAGTNVAQSFGTPADVFGGNLKPTVDLWYVIFAGDVDQDGGVGIYDMGRVENASNSFASGYLAEDVDGDGSVGIYDMGFIENNSNAFVGTTLPF
jgi:hypothetical protein